MSTTVLVLVARSGRGHVSHPDRPDYFLCGSGERHGGPVIVNSRETTAEQFRKEVGACAKCVRGLDNMDLAARIKSMIGATPKPAAPSYSKPGDTRLTATAGREGVLIYQHRYAGVSGPADEFPLPDGGESARFSIEELTTHVEAKGFRVVDVWRAVVRHDGIALEADVVRI